MITLIRIFLYALLGFAFATSALAHPHVWVTMRRGRRSSILPRDTLPPAQIGGFRRLDTVAEIRELAKNWHNCLAGYLFNVNDGTSATIWRSRWRPSVFWVATAAWAGFWFRPRVREMPPSSPTSSPKFMPCSPTQASHNLR